MSKAKKITDEAKLKMNEQNKIWLSKRTMIKSYIPNNDINKIDQFCFDNNISRAKLVREAINNYISNEPVIPKEIYKEIIKLKNDWSSWGRYNLNKTRSEYKDFQNLKNETQSILSKLKDIL